MLFGSTAWHELIIICLYFFWVQLKARRDHINHEVLAKKYAKDKQDLDVFGLGKNYESDKYQDTYIDEKDIQTQAKKKKFPWQNMKP